ncbi:MAG: DNA translocase FtsK [Lachnospiraceae bacterium]|nr:DNA translocase FtsK [Candidatus Minthocola equi]
MVGGALFELLYPSIGRLASYAILVVVSIICFVLATGKSFFAPLKSGSEAVKDRVNSRNEFSKERDELREAKRELKREKKRAAYEKKLAKAQAEADSYKTGRLAQRVSGVSLSETGIPAEAAAPTAQGPAGVTDMPETPTVGPEAVAAGEARAKAAAAAFAGSLGLQIHRTPADAAMLDENGEMNLSGINFSGQTSGDKKEYEARPRVRGVEQVTLEQPYQPEEPEIHEQPAAPINQPADSYDDSRSRVIMAPHDNRTISEIESEDIPFEEDITEPVDISGFDPAALDEASPEEALSMIKSKNSFAEPERKTSPVKPAERKPQSTSKPATSESIFGEHKTDPSASSGAVFSNPETAPKVVRPKKIKTYKMPPVSLLTKGAGKVVVGNGELRNTAEILENTLRTFGVGAQVTDISCGPTVTRYELHPNQGIKVSRIVALTDDIKLALAASEIRIEAPIPGKAAVGIEVPNSQNATVYFREMIESEEFKKSKSKLAFGIGRDIAGKVIIGDIAKMPHLLIAGSTGSGKSVCINTLILSILYHATPDEVKFIMIDPKMVELKPYNSIPHMMVPVVTDPKKAAGALNWAVAEMADRYQRFADMNVRDIASFNEKVEEILGSWDSDNHEEDEIRPEKMPQIVIIVDELADLMMTSPREVEDAVCRLAQLARAAGIHLVLETQRPSANVITGLIKANVPSRISFAVSSGIDSRIIIDMTGAEKLLGKGDMLYAPLGIPKPIRVQGSFASDEDRDAVIDYWSNLRDETNDAKGKEIMQKMAQASAAGSESSAGATGASGYDELFESCGRYIIEAEKASIGNLQRKFQIGFNRAARIMDQLAEAGVVGPEAGTKAREILMTIPEFEELLANLQ